MEWQAEEERKFLNGESDGSAVGRLVGISRITKEQVRWKR
jgi:hypothetical protein